MDYYYQIMQLIATKFITCIIFLLHITQLIIKTICNNYIRQSLEFSKVVHYQ